MNSNFSFNQRKEILVKLNENLNNLGQIALNLKDIKNKNNQLEAEMKLEINNSKIYENQKQQLLEELNELKKKNQDLINEKEKIDKEIKILQKSIEDKNK